MTQLLRDRLSQLYNISSPLVGSGSLEFGIQPLDQQIHHFAEAVWLRGVRQIQILPLFLLPGVHVMADLPAAVASATQAIPAQCALNLCPYLGAHPEIPQLLSQPMATTAADTWVLVAHGSRRPGANRPIEQLCQALAAHPAYWSVLPDLATQVQRLIHSGYTRIGILPYFLFPGAIPDAIALQRQQLQTQFPQVTLQLTQGLDANPKLVDLILDLSQTSPSCPPAL